MKIAFVGAGNMGGAIVRGLYQSGLCKASDLFVADVYQPNLDAIKSLDSEIFTTNINSEAVKRAECVVIAVKPWLVDAVISDIYAALDSSKHTVVSIAAGVSLVSISEKLGGSFPLFRVLPNTAISLRESMTFVSSLNASKEQEAEVLNMFNQLGLAIAVPENMMGAFTSVSSCGIAYALRFVRAMAQGAVELGVKPDQAHEVVAQTMIGAAQLILQNKSNPESEIDKVTTPGGWTIKGLNAMEANGFSNAVIQGVKANS